MNSLSKPPHDVGGSLSPFTFTVSEQEIKSLNASLAHPLPRASFENTTAELSGFGVSREWLAGAVEAWKTFDWQVLYLIIPRGAWHSSSKSPSKKRNSLTANNK